MGGKPRVGPAALSSAVLRLVHSMIPGVVEHAGEGGRVELHRRGPFAFIQPAADHVRVGFEQGAALPDVVGLLQGEEPRVRYAVVRTRADVESRGLQLLFAAALYDDDTHGFRRRLL